METKKQNNTTPFRDKPLTDNEIDLMMKKCIVKKEKENNFEAFENKADEEKGNNLPNVVPLSKLKKKPRGRPRKSADEKRKKREQRKTSVRMPADHAYCVKCKKATKFKDAKEKLSKKNRLYIKAKCSVCETNNCKFISNKKPETSDKNKKE